MKRTTVKLPDELDVMLRHEAARRGMTISQLTREAPAGPAGSGIGRQRSFRHLLQDRRDLGGRGVPPIPLIVDTGPIYAALDRRDRSHESSVELLTTAPGPLFVPQTVVTEVAYFVGERLGAEPEVYLIQNLALGTLIPEPVSPADWPRIAELVWRYRELKLGTVDASIIAMAERLGIMTIATLDHRHFGAVRPAHVEAFELVP
jgi:hypothetical protein